MAEIINEEIKEMKKDIAYLKKHMVDVDSIMTEDDFELLLDYRTEKEHGKLVSEEQLKKELNFNVSS
ncbi:MAG: hypothetical protein ACOC32_03770 [Nanoarchaeota archaeon]